jgi:hypothetical protein
VGYQVIRQLLLQGPQFILVEKQSALVIENTDINVENQGKCIAKQQQGQGIKRHNGNASTSLRS